MCWAERLAVIVAVVAGVVFGSCLAHPDHVRLVGPQEAARLYGGAADKIAWNEGVECEDPGFCTLAFFKACTKYTNEADCTGKQYDVGSDHRGLCTKDNPATKCYTKGIVRCRTRYECIWDNVLGCISEDDINADVSFGSSQCISGAI